MNGLFNSTILDVAIGLVFVYLLLAIISSAIQEWFARVLKTRATMLEKGITQLLDGQSVTTAVATATGTDPTSTKSFVDLFYKHPMMGGMGKGSEHPSYLPARTFASIVMDLVTHAKEGVIAFEDLEQGIKDLPDGDVRKALLALIQNCDKNLHSAQTRIESWFDDSMDRVSGWFKRRSQVVILAVAFGLTIFANADTIHIVRQLSIDPVLRNAVVEQAKVDSQKANAGVISPFSNEDKQLLGQMLGWQNVHPTKDLMEWFLRIFGWTLTAFAVSLGAPFWFDILNKVMNLRSAGKSPTEKAKSPEKPSQPPEDKKA